jgi:hypothetical protein
MVDVPLDWARRGDVVGDFDVLGWLDWDKEGKGTDEGEEGGMSGS